MDEMLEETMEEMDDEEELESEANEEVEKILFEITDGKLGVQNTKVGALPVSSLSSPRRIDELKPGHRQTAAEPTAEDLQKDEEMERAIAGLLNS